MADFISQFTGTQIDNGIDRALNPDATPTQGSDALVESGGVFAAINTAALSSAPAILNTASGAVCAFADGSASPMTSVIAEIVASQAGSGTPYPAGGGVNKFDIGETSDDWQGGPAYTPNVDAQTVSFTTVAQGGTFAYRKKDLPAGTYTLSFDEATSTGNAKRVFVRCFDADGNNISASTTIEGMTFNQFFGGLFYQGVPKTFTVPNTVDHFWAGVGVNAPSAGTSITLSHIQLELGSTATDYAPYSNIRPISGDLGANVTRAGRNMLAPHLYAGGVYNPTVGDTLTLTDSPTQLTPNADNTAYTLATTTAWATWTLLVPVVVGNTYKLSGSIGSTTLRTTVGFLDASYKVLSKANDTAAAQTWSATLTPTGDAAFYFITFSNGGTASETITLTNPQLELGSSAHAYAPYAGEVFSASWADEAGTVYGGTVDLVSGVLTVTHKGVDLGEVVWSITNNPNRYLYTAAVAVIPNAAANGSYNVAVSNTLCSEYPAISRSAVMGGNTGYQMENGAIYLRDSAIEDSSKSSADQITAYVAELTGQYVVYPLVTPETYNLTPQEVASLLGQNNVWNDVGGDTSAEYRADTKLYIQSLLGA